MEEVHNTHGTGKEPSLLRAIFRLFGWKYILFNTILILEVSSNVLKI